MRRRQESMTRESAERYLDVERDSTEHCDLESIPRGHFGLIMADPPWQFRTWSRKGTAKSADLHYQCRSAEWVTSISVRDFADKDCILWLWATNPLLPVALDVMAAWGFAFKTAGHWSKLTKHGKQAFGTGYILRCAGEPFLIGTVGSPQSQARNVRSVIHGAIREHSRKPEECFQAAEALAGDVPKLELFSRQARKGWHVFGDQLGHFGSK